MKTPPAGTRSRRVEVGGHRLHVETGGDGAPLLLLHGFTGSARSFDEIVAPLRRRHRTLAVDLLGHGRSDAPEDPAAWGMERCVADLVRVLDACDVGAAHVLGYSMGGRVALHLALAHPERVASLVLVGASAGLADAEARAARRRTDAAWAELLRREGIESFVERWRAQPLFASEARRGAAHDAHLRAERLANRPVALAASLAGLGTGAQAPLHDRLRDLARPVLLVVGAEDAKFRAVATELAARMPDARVAVVAEAGHAAHREAPERFLGAVIPFLAGSASATRRPNACNPGNDGGWIREQP